MKIISTERPRVKITDEHTAAVLAGRVVVVMCEDQLTAKMACDDLRTGNAYFWGLCPQRNRPYPVIRHPASGGEIRFCYE